MKSAITCYLNTLSHLHDVLLPGVDVSNLQRRFSSGDDAVIGGLFRLWVLQLTDEVSSDFVAAAENQRLFGNWDVLEDDMNDILVPFC